MALCDVVDQFLNKNGLTNAGAAEQTDFASLCIRCEQVDNLNTGDENFGFGRLVGEQRRFCVDRVGLCSANGATFVDRLTNDVHDAAKGHWANWNRNLGAGVANRLTTGQAFGRVHGDSADGVFAEMLRHFEDQAVAVIVGFKRRQNRWQLASESYVNNSADDLADAASCANDISCGLAGTRLRGRGLACRRFSLRGSGLRSGGLFRGGSHVFLPCLWMSLERFGARNNFDEFSGNRRLTRAVILNGQLVDHVACVARCIVHGCHF